MIEKRPGRDGKLTYRVKIFHRGRYIESRSFKRLTDAREWKRERQRDLSRGGIADSRAGDAPVSEWVLRWQNGLTGLAPDTVVRYEELARIHVVPEFGRRPLSSVRTSEVQCFAARLSSDSSPSVARQAVGVLRQVYKLALADGVVVRNPAEGVKLGKMPAGEPRPLSHGQLWRLALSMELERDTVLVLVAGYTGLRWGELTALRVSDWIVDQRKLVIDKAIADVRGKLVIGDVKTHRSRSVPVPETVASRLTEYVGIKESDELLFPSATGTPLSSKNFRRDKLATAPEIIGRTVTPHEFRDTAASLAIGAGASVVAVARMLGHEDAAVTLRHYANLLPSDLDDIADRMNLQAQNAIEQLRER